MSESYKEEIKYIDYLYSNGEEDSALTSLWHYALRFGTHEAKQWLLSTFSSQMGLMSTFDTMTLHLGHF